MSLQYAKESIVLSALKDVEENQKHMQEVNLSSSIVWKGKSLEMTTKLAAILIQNTRLTALNLTDCNIHDNRAVGIMLLAGALLSGTGVSFLHLRSAYTAPRSNVPCAHGLAVRRGTLHRIPGHGYADRHQRVQEPG